MDFDEKVFCEKKVCAERRTTSKNKIFIL